ncbi:hypothetical protein RF11_09995 [Thelohanellus kitauei]|uniref:Tc1-like transposase DDE domain-containing protein n=1 Tax=Thelohanellus kitauei TaxID=669202 RepID=A0A0C2NAL8_THEKT|nr:hypothetical protein RF11_09995 [Thelohanellus kitauei]
MERISTIRKNRSSTEGRESCKIIKQHVEDDCSLILEKSSDRFFNATNIRISKKTIKFIPERRNIASTIQERDDYVIKYLEYSTSNRFILFIDETWFNISMRRNYGRATGGNPTEKIKKYQISEHNNQQSMKARTNNCLERYNRITNEKFANPHPNIQQFIDVLKKEESYYASLCRNIRSGALERELVTCVEKRNISEELIAYLQEFNPE